MQKLYRIVLQITYFLGLLSLIVGILSRLLPRLQHVTEPRGILIFAGVLFLAALASAAIRRPEAS
jgi:hypothetical protein